MKIRMVAPIAGYGEHVTPTLRVQVGGPAVSVDEREADRLLHDFPDAFELEADDAAETPERKTAVIRASRTKRG